MFIDSHITVGATLGVILLKDILTLNTSDDFVTTIVAFIIGVFVGFFPDLDFLNKKIKSNIYYLEHHRTWTHSVLIHIPLSIIFAKVMVWLQLIEGHHFWFCSISFFIILFSHIVLDLFTSWGVYLFYPFKKVVATSSISIVDLFFSITMLIQVVLVLRGKNSNVMYLPIIVAFVYLIYAYCLSFYIKKIFRKALLKQDISYYEIDVKPTFMNTILWTINVRTKYDSYLVGYYSILQKNKEITFAEFKRNEDLIDYDDAELLVIIARMKKVLNHWYSFSITHHQLYINDVRYGFKTTDLDETEFAQSFLVKKHKGNYDVYRKIKFKKGWFKKLIIKFFKN